MRALLPTDAETRRRFAARRAERVLPVARVGSLGAVVTFAAFGARDAWLAPEHLVQTSVPRVVACVLFSVAAWATARAPLGFAELSWLVPATVTVGAVCVSLITTALPGGFESGIGGPVLFVMAAPLVSPSTRSTALTGLAAVLVPNLVMLLTRVPIATMVSVNHYLVFAWLLAVGMGRELERTHRDAFALELELERLAGTDPLTGVANRRRLHELADAEVGRARRHGHPLALLVLDLDGFKAVNDRYGHLVGDEVLRALPSRWRRQLREHDVLARVGGEEFAVLLPETDLEQALAAAERLRASLDGERLPVPAATPGRHPTVSVGCAAWREAQDGDFDGLYRRADQALYAAKRAGRNRVMAG